MKPPLLDMSDVSKSFVGRTGRGRRVVRALNRVSFELTPGESLGLVGESGCGKTTLARIVVGLEAPSSGRLALSGIEYPERPREVRRLLASKVQMVFQDPKSSLNPKKTAEEILTAPLAALTDLSPSARGRRARELVDFVDLPPEILSRYPHEISGGQAQRLAIARALAATPELLVLDEAVASLDVSVQAHILRLLYRLKKQLGLSYLFISHDLATVEVLSDQIAVMYLGSLVEKAPTRTLLEAPKHPYTRALLSAVPRLFERKRRIELLGEPPSPAHPPTGCAFHPRCYRAEARCSAETPTLHDGAVDHPCACFFAHDSAPPEPGGTNQPARLAEKRPRGASPV